MVTNLAPRNSSVGAAGCVDDRICLSWGFFSFVFSLNGLHIKNKMALINKRGTRDGKSFFVLSSPERYKSKSSGQEQQKYMQHGDW